MIQKRKTFENFVVGPCNMFAHGSALAAAERPGTVFNPLTIYSEKLHGVGKTHLLHAIANRLEEKGMSVAVLSADQFTEMLMNSIMTKGSTIPCRESLLELDAILLDDLEGGIHRETIMSELTKLVDYMIENGKQVVFGSGIPVDELPESHLASTLHGGLLAELQPLDRETAREYLLAKAEQRGLQLTETQICDILDKNTGDACVLLGKLVELQLRQELYSG